MQYEVETTIVTNIIVPAKDFKEAEETMLKDIGRRMASLGGEVTSMPYRISGIWIKEQQ